MSIPTILKKNLGLIFFLLVTGCLNLWLGSLAEAALCFIGAQVLILLAYNEALW